MRLPTLFICLTLLSGCSGDPAVPTSEENRQLDDASQMLNEAPANLEAVDEGGLSSASNLANEIPVEAP